MTTRVVILSDTHITPHGSRRLPDAVYELLDGADMVLHAGDIVSAGVLDELGGFAPTYAVMGNNDHDPALSHLPETRIVEVEGVRIGMIHDSGPREGREARMKRRFPDCDVVVYGHSHVPHNAAGIDGQLLFNPGSSTDKRMMPTHTAGFIDIDGDRVVHADVVEVSPVSPR